MPRWRRCRRGERTGSKRWSRCARNTTSAAVSWSGFSTRRGLPCFEPRGAFYVYPSTEKLGITGEEFANGLLRAEKVAVVPGDAFGEGGKYHVRCSYATSMKNLDEAT